ncbi:putative chromosome-partitioning protein ParB [Patescibacteria group bacterium]|nr:putative chromosome-partitioning protein ParB [Patescibacteria group bacterium]
MSKDLKKMLEEKLQQNNQRHAEANQVVDFKEGKQYTLIPLDNIDPNPYQPRRIFPQAELENLAASIAEIGLLEPILVRKINNRYQIAAGERRWRAYMLLNKRSIEALISSISDSDMSVFALAENIDREDLSDYEISLALRQIETIFPSRKKLAESLGFNREDMYRYFAFDDLPEFIRADLNNNPRLLSRSAANDIKRLLKQQENLSEMNAYLIEAWSLLLAGELEQTKLAAYISKKLSALSLGHRIESSQSLFQSGKKIGNVSSNSKHITVKLNINAISPQQEQQLKDFLAQLLNGELKKV